MRTTLNLGALGLALALLVSATGWAQEAPASRERGARGGWLLPGAGDEIFHTGFVLVNGAYVPPPYVIRGEDGVLLAGGVQVAAPQPGRGQRRGDKAENELRRMLRTDACFVVQAGEPVIVLAPFPAGATLFSLLLSGQDRSTAVSDLMRHSAPEVWAVLWRDWLLRFTPSPEFQARASRVLAENLERQRARLARAAALQRLRSAEFPLLACALLLAALAGWHLLRTVPTAPECPAGAEASPAAGRLLVRSLLLVLALAALDGVWTWLSAQAGQMRELNPLAARLLDRPDALLSFKLACTLGPVGLIYFLRHYRAAQLAAWWMCFITTAVACRWVVQVATL